MFTQFIHPLKMLICGSGKTTFLENVITNMNDLFNISIDRTIWCYGEESAKPNFEKVEYFKGVHETIENYTNKPILLIKMCLSCLQKDHTIGIY